MFRKRVWIAALMLALLAAVVVVSGVQLAGGPVERLTNGDFESGFYWAPVGQVGLGWQWFHNAGAATYGYYDETWAPVVYDGQHGQLIEINTYGRGGSDADRYAGIYQTVAVVPGKTYELTLHGMLRALADDPERTDYGYRVQYGVDYDGGTDWTQVQEWVEVPWDTVYPRLDPGGIESYSANITATGPRLTLFLRVWKKWGTAGRELNFNLDGISLKGAMPSDTGAPTVQFTAPDYPVAGWRYPLTVEAENGVGITRIALYDDGEPVGEVTFDAGLLTASHEFTWQPADAGTHTLKAVVEDVAGATAAHQVTVAVGQEGQFLVNGDFEGGFAPGPWGEVGAGWTAFTNGGQTTYGFYDETWPPVIYEGDHAQLIEVDTFHLGSADPDRYAGIYQTVDGLTVGATYKLSLHGMLRLLSNGGEEGDYSYVVQWGYDPGGGTDWTAVDNWTDLPWNTLYPRLEPGEMSAYTASFQAPSPRITLFLRVWKKWATTDRELDWNLDAITLKGYR